VAGLLPKTDKGLSVHMRFLAPLGLVAGLVGCAAVAAAQGTVSKEVATGTGPKAVVELFTSQGCSSCPEADALLGRLAERSDVLAMSFPVDYWDYLGWKDTLANPKFTERQKAYKSGLAVQMVYTPMMVVNGLTHVNGSDESKVQQAIESSAKVFAATQVPLRLSESGSHIVIEAGAAQQGGPAKEATVWLAQLANSVAVPITRGENRGKTITYHNVVRDLVPVGLWSGQPITVQLDRPSVVRPGAERCAAFLQQGRGGPIIGAAELTQC
jgi:hypothetical protein